MNTISNPMREVRLALGLSQSQMAKRLKTSVMTVRRCEYQNRTPGTVGARETFGEAEKEARAKLKQQTTTTEATP